MREKTVDIEDEAERIREEEIPEIKESQEEIVEEVDEKFESVNEAPQQYHEGFEELEELRIERKGLAETLERVAEEYGGSEFTIRELSGGALMSIQDTVVDASFDFDANSGRMDGTPRDGYGRIEVLRRAIVSAPPGAPDDPADYPGNLFMYLFNEVDAMNTGSDEEADLGNSLRERMTN